MKFIPLKRRDFITLLAGAAAWPLVARAQQPGGMRRIGMLIWLTDDAATKARIAAFAQEFQNLGWLEGRNFRIDYRWASGNEDRLQAFAEELVAMTPDVILVVATPALRALHQKTRTIPIVFLLVSDQLMAVLSKACRGQVAILRVSPISSFPWLASGWSCFRRLPPILPA